MRTPAANLVDELLMLERRRCASLQARDLSTLATLLSDSLIYTHSTGVVQDKAAFLDYAAEPTEFLAIERSNLQVRLMGTAALMTGMMKSVMLFPGQAAQVTVQTHVTQVWETQEGGWRLAAFQATRLPTAGL